MKTLRRTGSRTPSAGRLGRAGYVIVALGYALMTLGILEIGGTFNIALGLTAAMTGCTLMFAAEGGEALVAEFRRQLEGR